MAINNNTLAYALNQPTLFVPIAPIVSNRDPVGSDKYEIGSTWVNKVTNRYFVETSFLSGNAVWQLVVSGFGSLDQITSNAGVILPAAGNINAVGGGTTNITTSGVGSTLTIAVIPSPSFTGTVTAATGFTATTGNIIASTGNITATLGSISAGTTVTAGTGITSTTGNIVASAGNINATLGSMSANTTVTAGTTLIGGTGLTISAFTAGAIVSSNTGIFSSIPGTTGQVLTSNGAGVAPSFQAASSAPSTTITYVQTATTPYVALSTDIFIGIDSSGGARQVNLPNAPATGRIFAVKDYTGSAATNNITVTTVGGVVLIDGAATYVLNTNYQSIQLIFNGTSYEVF